MATQEKQKQNDEEYAGAFNEPDQSKPDQSEDEAFGITPEITDDGQGEGEPANEAIPEEAAEPAAEEATETPEQEQAEPEMSMEEMPMNQNDKTWNGRLNKREEDLNAREKALAEKEQGGETKEAISPDEATQKLSDDFGPDFVEMIKSIATGIAESAASKVAGDTVQAVDRDVKEIIAHLQDEGQKAHFEKISGKHPDFMDIASSPEFEAWLKTRPEAEQEKDAKILSSGSSTEVIGIIDQFKASTQQSDDGADAAEGVRSGGIKLPESPAADTGDYATAWDQA